VRVRRATPADIPAMAQIERASPNSAHWSHEHYRSLFETAPESFGYLVWVAEDPELKSVTVSAPTSSIVAYLAVQCVDRDWELQYIVVAKKSRRRGLATLLLNKLIGHARANNASAIFLEVRASNQSARALYRKMGFKETGVRNGYYPDPPEDAILCRLSLY
jgi:ribosomal-protein-alanine N-acetyltransferase